MHRILLFKEIITSQNLSKKASCMNPSLFTKNKSIEFLHGDFCMVIRSWQNKSFKKSRISQVTKFCEMSISISLPLGSLFKCTLLSSSGHTAKPFETVPWRWGDFETQGVDKQGCRCGPESRLSKPWFQLTNIIFPGGFCTICGDLRKLQKMYWGRDLNLFYLGPTSVVKDRKTVKKTLWTRVFHDFFGPKLWCKKNRQRWNLPFQYDGPFQHRC